MKILKKKNNRDDTIKRIVNYLSHFDSKYHHYILNGNYKSIANWSVLNEILFFEDHCEKVLPFFILKYEIDLNLRNKKGVSFFIYICYCYFITVDIEIQKKSITLLIYYGLDYYQIIS